MKIKGIVNAYLVDENDDLIEDFPANNNFMTKAGKSLLAAQSVGALMSQSLNLYGQLSSLDTLYTMGGASSTVYGIDADNYRSLTLILAQIDDAKTKDSLNIPVFTGSQTNSVNVIGYVNNDIIPNSDGVGGVDAFVNETPVDNTFYGYIDDPYTQARRFKFDLNTAVGTFNAIILTPYTNAVLGIMGGGFRTMKNLDAVNMIYQNFVSGSTAFIPPEVGSITGVNEVITDYNQDTYTRHKTDLDTGVITRLPNNTPFPSLDMKFVTDMTVVDNYLYVFRMTNKTGSSGSVLVYDVLDNFALKTTISITSNSGSNNPIIGGYFVYHESKLFVSTQRVYASQYSAAEYRIVELNHNGTYWATIKTNHTNFTAIDWVNPTSLPDAFIGVKTMADGTFAVIVPQINSTRDKTELPNDLTKLYSVHYPRQAYILTNKTDALDQAIINHKQLGPGAIIHATTTGIHRVFSIGKDVYDPASSTGFGPTDDYNQKFGRMSLRNLTKTALFNTSTDLYTKGLYFSTAEQSHAHVSIYKLDAPVTKTNLQRLFITYAVGLEDEEV